MLHKPEAVRLEVAAGSHKALLFIRTDRIASIRQPLILRSWSFNIEGTDMNERTGSRMVSYSSYGFGGLSDSNSGLGFCGYWSPMPIRNYLLGNGYRMYNPGLMRFHSADGLSPFAAGGINPYMYCNGDPVNMKDASGRAGTGIKELLKQHGARKKYIRPLMKLLKLGGRESFTLISVNGEDATSFQITIASSGYSAVVSSTGRKQNQLPPGTYLNKKNLYVPWEKGVSSKVITLTTDFKEFTLNSPLSGVTLDNPRTGSTQGNEYTYSPVATDVGRVRGDDLDADSSGEYRYASTSRR